MPKLHSIPRLFKRSFLIDNGDHLQSKWGSFAVWGSFAQFEHSTGAPAQDRDLELGHYSEHWVGPCMYTFSFGSAANPLLSMPTNFLLCSLFETAFARRSLSNETEPKINRA